MNLIIIICCKVNFKDINIIHKITFQKIKVMNLMLSKILICYNLNKSLVANLFKKMSNSNKYSKKNSLKKKKNKSAIFKLKIKV